MESIEIVSRRGAGGQFLKATFSQQGDRYAHQIAIGEGRLVRELLRSCEGTDRSPWPISPPMQQLTEAEQRNGDQVLLLVGQAGRSHWSMSVEPDPTAAALTFDVACRVQQESEWLGSTYGWEGPSEISIAAQTAEIHSAQCRCRLLVQSDGSAASHIESAGEQQLRIGAVTTPGPLPRTVRWKYRLEIAG